jgi:hypothetical protein
MFLKVSTFDGEEFISEFAKLKGTERYLAQVFMGRAFNVWKDVASVHPHSGEPCLMRTRVSLSGRAIKRVQRVVRKADAAPNSMSPADFEPEILPQSGQGGIWVAPTQNTPDGAVAGASYPVHIDPTSLDRYVILSIAREGRSEVRYALGSQETMHHAGSVDELLSNLNPADRAVAESALETRRRERDARIRTEAEARRRNLPPGPADAEDDEPALRRDDESELNDDLGESDLD